MPQEPCAFYCVEDVNMPIKTITTEGSIVSSMIMRREWCAHPRADHLPEHHQAERALRW